MAGGVILKYFFCVDYIPGKLDLHVFWVGKTPYKGFDFLAKNL